MGRDVRRSLSIRPCSPPRKQPRLLAQAPLVPAVLARCPWYHPTAAQSDWIQSIHNERRLLGTLGDPCGLSSA